MFIRKSQYRAPLMRLNSLEHQYAALEKADAALQSDGTELFFGFSEDIHALRLQLSDLVERLTPLEEQTEQLEEDRQAERRFIRGANNILNYGVTYGRDKTLKADR